MACLCRACRNNEYFIFEHYAVTEPIYALGFKQTVKTAMRCRISVYSLFVYYKSNV